MVVLVKPSDSFLDFENKINAQLVELADTLDLGSSAERRGGSTPSLGTTSLKVR